MSEQNDDALKEIAWSYAAEWARQVDEDTLTDLIAALRDRSLSAEHFQPHVDRLVRVLSSEVIAICAERKASSELLAPPVPKRGWGVYVLIDKHDKPIYVGMTGRPRRRLGEHRREFGNHIHRYEWNDTDSRRDALDLEARLIRDLNPRMNLVRPAVID